MPGGIGESDLADWKQCTRAVMVSTGDDRRSLPYRNVLSGYNGSKSVFFKGQAEWFIQILSDGSGLRPTFDTQAVEGKGNYPVKELIKNKNLSLTRRNDS